MYIGTEKLKHASQKLETKLKPSLLLYKPDIQSESDNLKCRVIIQPHLCVLIFFFGITYFFMV